jgi:PAS domain S-box-containing protein
LLQNISDVIISTDVDFRIVSWNKAAEEMYGWTQQEVLNKPITDVVKPVYEKESREDILSAYFKNNYWKGEVIHHTRLGERLSVLVTTTVLQQEGAKTGTVAVIRDITQRKRAEQNFRDLLNAAPDATVIVNAKGIIQMVNKRVEELFLFQREELVNQPVEMLMPLALKENHVRHMQQYVREPRVRPMGAGMELQARRRDGSLFPVEISLSPLETEAGLLVSASIRDITERRAIEQRLMMFNEELEQQVQARTTEILQINDQLRLLSSRLEEVREQERIRIAREIHDELGQQLTGLKMDISWLSKKTGHMDEHLQQKFTGVLGLLDEMVQTVRRISTELRPAVLDDLGLLAAIEWHSAEFEKRFHINLQLSLPGDDLVVPVEKATGIFRVYQEALTNIARHAGATQVWTTVSVKEDRFILLVEDNGRGFDAREVKARKTLGLAGMKERVNMMAGRYSITSTTDRGTVVSIEVPLQY